MVYLDEASVRNLLNHTELTDVLRKAFVGDIQAPPRTHHHIPGSAAATMLLMPAWNAHSIGVKVLTLDPARTQRGLPSIGGLYLLMDCASGATLAILEARVLTAVRTAAVSALAATYLAPVQASVLLMVGTGNLAPFLIEAHCAARDYRHVIVWGRDRQKAEEVRDRITTLSQFSIATDLNSAVASADVICCATSSTHPLIYKQHVKAGAHLDLIGSYTPNMREADPALFERARVFVDTKDAILESGDLIDPHCAGLLDTSAIRDLRELICDPSLSRRGEEGITIFKAAGTAAADLAVAEYLVQKHAAAHQHRLAKH